MAISATGSYLPTMQEFINHWTQANAELDPTPIVLQGGYTLANLTADRTALENAIIALQPANNTRSIAAADRDIKKNAIRTRLVQFRALVAGLMSGSVYVRSLPTLPRFTNNESSYLAPLDDMANLWSQINAAPPTGFTAPLVLQGDYTQVEFIAEIAALRAAFVASSNATRNASIARERRDLLLPNIRARLGQYRQVAKAVLPPTSPLAGTIPALSPPPGSTPQPVSVSGVWSVGTEEALLTWTPSDNPALDNYSVRIAPGPVYKAAEESVVASVPKTTTSFGTTAGLAAVGAVALYRVYVVLTTGNERGSATVRVERPPNP